MQFWLRYTPLMHRLGVLTLLATATLIAQSPTATITGIARDAQGAVIPGVQLTATSIATQQKVDSLEESVG